MTAPFVRVVLLEMRYQSYSLFSLFKLELRLWHIMLLTETCVNKQRAENQASLALKQLLSFVNGLFHPISLCTNRIQKYMKFSPYVLYIYMYSVSCILHLKVENEPCCILITHVFQIILLFAYKVHINCTDTVLSLEYNMDYEKVL